MLVPGGGTSAAARPPISLGLAAPQACALTSWHSKPRGLLGPLRCALLGRWWGCGGGWQVRAAGTAGQLTEAVHSLQQPPSTSICCTLVAQIDYNAVCSGRSNSASAALNACCNWAASRPSAGAGATLLLLPFNLLASQGSARWWGWQWAQWGGPCPGCQMQGPHPQRRRPGGPVRLLQPPPRAGRRQRRGGRPAVPGCRRCRCRWRLPQRRRQC